MHGEYPQAMRLLCIRIRGYVGGGGGSVSESAVALSL